MFSVSPAFPLTNGIMMVSCLQGSLLNYMNSWSVSEDFSHFLFPLLFLSWISNVWAVGFLQAQLWVAVHPFAREEGV